MNILFPNGFHANLSSRVCMRASKLFNSENQHNIFFSKYYNWKTLQDLIILQIIKKKKKQAAENVSCAFAQTHTAW